MKIKYRGISLIGLLVTLAITSILLFSNSTALLYEYYQRQRIKTIADNLFHALQAARMDAVASNRPVSVCGTHNFIDCQTTWSQGFMIFVEDHQQKRILYQQALKDTVNINSKGISKFIFSPDGRCLTRGTIAITAPAMIKKIVIYDSGRVRFQ